MGGPLMLDKEYLAPETVHYGKETINVLNSYPFVISSRVPTHYASSVTMDAGTAGLCGRMGSTPPLLPYSTRSVPLRSTRVLFINPWQCLVFVKFSRPIVHRWHIRSHIFKEMDSHESSVTQLLLKQLILSTATVLLVPCKGEQETECSHILMLLHEFHNSQANAYSIL